MSDLLEIPFHIYERGQKFENFEIFGKFKNLEWGNHKVGTVAKHRRNTIGRHIPLFDGLPSTGSAELGKKYPGFRPVNFGRFSSRRLQPEEIFGRPTLSAANLWAQQGSPVGPAPARSDRQKTGGHGPAEQHSWTLRRRVQYRAGLLNRESSGVFSGRKIRRRRTQCKKTTGRRSSDAERSPRARRPTSGHFVRLVGRISANDDGVQPAEKSAEPGRLANHQAWPRRLRRMGRWCGRVVRQGDLRLILPLP